MKYIVFALLALTVASSFFNMKGKLSAFKQFTSWERKFNAQYENQDERLYRFTVFIEGLERIKNLQDTDPDARYAPTKFADLTPAEFEAQYLNSYERTERNEVPVIGDAPDEWDWSTKAAVTEPKDQGSCDSAWAMSTVACVEGYHAIAHSKLLDLSVQQVLDCDTEDTGCNGGNPATAFTYMIKAGGLESDWNYPYTGVQNKCRFNSTLVEVKLLDYKDVPKSDENAFKEALYASGPIAAMLNGSSLQYYDGGIFSPAICSPKKLSHVVSCIGYGKEKKKDFWKCKNSWGTAWGEEGFFRIIRGKNKCGIANAAAYAEVQK